MAHTMATRVRRRHLVAAALLLACGARAKTPYTPLTCCGFGHAMMQQQLFKCVVGEEGKPWSEYCANAEAQHCAYMVKLQMDVAPLCCERCRLRRLGDWDPNNPQLLGQGTQHVATAPEGFTYPTFD